MINQT